MMLATLGPPTHTISLLLKAFVSLGQALLLDGGEVYGLRQMEDG